MAMLLMPPRMIAYTITADGRKSAVAVNVGFTSCDGDELAWPG